MSKKIIAVLLVATILFMFAFAACNKDKDEEKEEPTKVFADSKDYDFVTDESGNRVLSPDGEFVVYVTDEDGKNVTNKSGEPETIYEQFVPIFEDGKVENYGYSIELPDGWKPSETNNDTFINESKKQKVTITAIDKTYAEYHTSNKELYDAIAKKEGVTATWEENYDLGNGCSKVVRFTLKTKDGMNVMYIFVNNGNLYKVLFEAADPATAVADSEAICAVVSYKPYKYFEAEVTDASDVAESVWESVIAGDAGAQPITSEPTATKQTSTTVAAATTKAQ